MVEFEAQQRQPIALLLPGRSGVIMRFASVSALMPFQFSADDLPVV
jgi:cytidine deaminase